MLNLLANAVRLGPLPWCGWGSDAVGEDRVAIHVIDEGPGIPAELLRRAVRALADRLGADAGREGGAWGWCWARRLTEAMGWHAGGQHRRRGTHIIVQLRAAGAGQKTTPWNRGGRRTGGYPGNLSR
ncbi:MAG: ATP-binding protein [Acidimicrobiales bacterium]